MRPQKIQTNGDYPIGGNDYYITIKSKIRGLFNDLTRTLLASAIYMDDLNLQIEKDSEEYYNWWNANAQITQAIIFYLELRNLFYEHFLNSDED